MYVRRRPPAAAPKCNSTDKISMAPARGWLAHIGKHNQSFITGIVRGPLFRAHSFE